MSNLTLFRTISIKLSCTIVLNLRELVMDLYCLHMICEQECAKNTSEVEGNFSMVLGDCRIEQ